MENETIYLVAIVNECMYSWLFCMNRDLQLFQITSLTLEIIAGINKSWNRNLNFLNHILFYYCYLIFQVGTGGHTQKARPVEVLTHSQGNLEAKGNLEHMMCTDRKDSYMQSLLL